MAPGSDVHVSIPLIQGSRLTYSVLIFGELPVFHLASNLIKTLFLFIYLFIYLFILAMGL